MKIIRLNSFGAPRSTYQSINNLLRNDKDGKTNEKPGAHTTCGLWYLASRINHSCVTNCRRSFIGDMQIVRACQDMEADTELCFGYQSPLPHQTYKETQEKLRSWGFACSCVLCLDKKSNPRNTIQRRTGSLTNSLKATLKPGASIVQLRQARKILEDLEKTYTTSEDAASVPPLELQELSDPYFALGAQLLEKKKPEDGLEMLLKGLEALGFGIVASPPRDVIDEKNRKKPTLEIKRWGQAKDYTTSIFFHMILAYEELAPELCKVAKEYAGVAYSICYGEKETIGKLHPRLA